MSIDAISDFDRLDALASMNAMSMGEGQPAKPKDEDDDSFAKAIPASMSQRLAYFSMEDRKVTLSVSANAKGGMVKAARTAAPLDVNGGVSGGVSISWGGSEGVEVSGYVQAEFTMIAEITLK